MFSHVFLGIGDFERALAFYQPLMSALGHELRFNDASRPWAGWQPHAGGNGQMVAFAASSRAMVDSVYAIAMAHGGKCEGKPGLRPEYHEHYYGAYFRDPDGNKLCVVCHDAQD